MEQGSEVMQIDIVKMTFISRCLVSKINLINAYCTLIFRSWELVFHRFASKHLLITHGLIYFVNY